MIKESILQEEKQSLMYMYLISEKSKYVEQKLIELEEKIDN